jgi:hypothetical protein
MPIRIGHFFTSLFVGVTFIGGDRESPYAITSLEVMDFDIVT